MDITTAFNQKNFVIPKADFTTQSHYNVISLIMKRHGEEALDVKMIDDNDEYDSFLVESGSGSFCIKLSFDSLAIFYEFMILKGIESLAIAPVAIDRNQIEYGKTIYYTIQTYEHSDNLASNGGSSILLDHYTDFNYALSRLHTSEPPLEIHQHLDDTKSYLRYHNENFFGNIFPYVDKNEIQIHDFLKQFFTDVYSEMMQIFYENEEKLNQKKLVHGNLDLSTVIENSFRFKFINFENTFIGNPLFDVVSLVFELQMTGLKEFDFVSKAIDGMRIVDHRFAAGSLLDQYRICKKIWTRKRFLDLIKEYAKEIIVYNKTRVDKVLKIGNEFSKHYYRFSEINAFLQNKEVLVNVFNDLILKS